MFRIFNFTIFNQKMYFKHFWKGKKILNPHLKLITYRFVVKPDIFGKEAIYRITILLIISLNNVPRHGSVPYHFK